MTGGLVELVSGERSMSVNIVRQTSKCSSTVLLSEWKRLRCVSGVPGATETTGRICAEPTWFDA
jgi:hypothetical protein